MAILRRIRGTDLVNGAKRSCKALGGDDDLNGFAHAAPPICTVNLIEPLASCCSGFNPAFFDRVSLNEAVQLFGTAPPAAEVIVSRLFRGQIGDDWGKPSRLHGKFFDFTAGELGFAVDGRVRLVRARIADGWWA